MRNKSSNNRLPNRDPPNSKLPPKSKKTLQLPSITKPPNGSPKPHPRQQSHSEQALNNLIHEYLIKYNYMETLNVFQAEYYNGGAPEQQHLKDELLNAFDKGQRNLFFEKFNKYVPVNIRMKDQRTTKLEFYLNIFFLVYSTHPAFFPAKKKIILEMPAKQAFKQYLESRGAALAKTSEFLPYYALVYIEQPQDNPAFKHIFSKDWTDELRGRLVEYVEYLYPNQKVPLLVQIYEKYVEESLMRENALEGNYEGSYQGHFKEQLSQSLKVDEPPKDELVPARITQQGSQVQIKKMQDHIKYLTEYNQATTERYMHLWNNFIEFQERVKNTLMESQTKWFQITQEFFNISSNLLNIADNLKKGIPLENDEILENIRKKVRKYESFVNANIQDLISQNLDFSLFDRPSVSADNDHRPQTPSMRQARSVYQSRAPLIQIDFDKVRATLNGDDPLQVCLLLQALRWRITRVRGIYQKRQAVIVCTKNDIIGSPPPERRDKLLRRLLNWQPTVVWETAQFITSLADDYEGRTYLLNDSFIECIIEAMQKEQNDTKIRTPLLTTLQKISLRRAGQLCMVKNGLVKWTLDTIKAEKDRLEGFSLDYIVALLLNLSLSKQGLQKCEEIKDDIISVLSALLEHESAQVRTFSSAILFAVLSLKSFRLKAKQYGLLDVISFLKERSPPDYLKQLQYLQNLLRLGDDQQDQQQQDVQSDCDVDDIVDQPMGEEPLDKDYVEIVNGKLTGEMLLIKEYALTGPAFINYKFEIRDEVAESLKRRENAFMKRINSVDRPVSQNRSVMRPFMKSRSVLNASGISQTSNRMLPSEMRQRTSQTANANQAEDLGQNIKPISPISGPRPQKEYEKAPQYRKAFETRERIIRTPPQQNYQR